MPFMTRPRMRRIDALHGVALAAAVRRREGKNYGLNGDDLLRRFAEADPSRNKSATQWLVRCYLANGFRLEDLGKAYDTLVAFARHRKRLPSDTRDLGRYRTLAELWKAVRPFAMAQDIAPATGREARRREREQARSESHILFEGEDGFTVAVPMTEFASRWWGRGTRWCTAAEKNNAFLSYHIKAPLIVILLPDGQKLQLFVSDDPDFQMMDEDDGKVSEELIEQSWQYLEPIFRWAVSQNGMILGLIPEHLRDQEMCFEAVRQNGNSLSFAPKGLCNREMYLEAVNQSGEALEFVPEQFRDREICLKSTQQNGYALKFVPEDFQDREICLNAVRQEGYALKLVPEHIRDRELCLDAVRNSGYALEFVPRNLVINENRLEAVGRHEALRCVFKEINDREIYIEAIKQNGYALKFVPEEFRDREMCLKAVEQCGEALEFVPDNLRDSEMCLKAVSQNGYALEFVPLKIRDRDLSLKAVRCKGLALNDVFHSIRDREIYIEAVKQNGLALHIIRENLRDREICLEAISQNRDAFLYVPTHMRSEFPEPVAECVPIKRQWRDDILNGLRVSFEVFPVSEESTFGI